MIVKLLTEHHLECLSLKGDCTGSSESTLGKIPHCWESHAMAQLFKSFLCTSLIEEFSGIEFELRVRGPWFKT